jgi:hypothetical protein
MSDALSTILASSTVERVRTGFGFTEGLLWHPHGLMWSAVQTAASILPTPRCAFQRSSPGA